MKDERGVSTIVGAIFLIAIFLAAFSAFYPFYLNKAVSEAESSHMTSVRNSFLEIKSKVESMPEGESRSVSVQMSFEPPPFFFGAIPSGTVSVSNRENEFNVISFNVLSRYSPNQTYSYESGGVILVQNGVEIMRSKSALVTAWESTGENIRVNVHYIWIENSSFAVASGGERTIHISKKSSFYKHENDHLENVVLDLDGKVKYENAWRKYLEEKNTEFNDKGFNAELEGLKLTIHGKRDGPADIFYYEKFTKLMVSFS